MRFLHQLAELGCPFVVPNCIPGPYKYINASQVNVQQWDMNTDTASFTDTDNIANHNQSARKHFPFNENSAVVDASGIKSQTNTA